MRGEEPVKASEASVTKRSHVPASRRRMECVVAMVASAIAETKDRPGQGGSRVDWAFPCRWIQARAQLQRDPGMY